MQRKIVIMAIITMNISCSHSTDDPKKGVEMAVDQFKETMLHPDEQRFEQLTSPILSYGHSTGLIENRQTCIHSMVSGKFTFQSIELSDQTIDLSGNTAIVRHHFFAHTHDRGKEPGEVRLKILQVWQNDGGHWTLLARQAVK